MMENLKDLSEKVTQLSNNFVDIALSRGRSGQSPIFVSLFEAAPEGFPTYMVERLATIIQGELLERPEIHSVQFLSVLESTKTKVPGRLTLAVECETEYRLDKAPEKPLSMARMAEIGERSLEYVYEQSEDPVHDLTERLGLSMNEVSILDPTYTFFETPANHSNLSSEQLIYKIQDAHLRSGMQISDAPNHSELALE